MLVYFVQLRIVKVKQTTTNQMTTPELVHRNMRMKTIINPLTGKREDRTDYPITAIREAILNALVHRDYSIHTEGMPIQLIMYEDRIEIKNPGRVHGRIRIDQLGKVSNQIPEIQ